MARINTLSGGSGTDIMGYNNRKDTVAGNLVNSFKNLANNVLKAVSNYNKTNTNPSYLGNDNSGGYSSYSGGSASWTTPATGYELDLSPFSAARQSIIDSANSSKNILKQRYDNLLREIENRRKEGNEQFGQGRASISEDAYDRSRENANNLASRGLSNSGLQQLGEVQERMETGQQMNDLASQYYSYLNDLDQQRAEGEQTYNEGLASIESNLQQQLASIGLQEFQAQDDYNRYMSDLAMQMYSLTSPSYGYGSSYGGSSNDDAAKERSEFEQKLQGLKAANASGMLSDDDYNAMLGAYLYDYPQYGSVISNYYIRPQVESTEESGNTGLLNRFGSFINSLSSPDRSVTLNGTLPYTLANNNVNSNSLSPIISAGSGVYSGYEPIRRR